MGRGRPGQRFCLRGHDTRITGRYAQGSCRQCSKERLANERKGVKLRGFCVRGHDVVAGGRTPGGTCLECQRLFNLQAYRRANRGNMRPRDPETLSNRAAGLTPLTQLRIDAAPLVEWLKKVENLSDSDDRAMWRARQVGTFTPAKVDDLCIRVLRVNPSAVYGDAFYAEGIPVEESA